MVETERYIQLEGKYGLFSVSTTGRETTIATVVTTDQFSKIPSESALGSLLMKEWTVVFFPSEQTAKMRLMSESGQLPCATQPLEIVFFLDKGSFTYSAIIGKKEKQLNWEEILTAGSNGVVVIKKK